MTSFVGTIPPPPFSGLELGPLDLRMYGLLIAVGAYLALRLSVRRYAEFGGDPELAERAALIGLAGGLLGARIGYVLPRVTDFVSRPQDILAIWQGGLAIFGGLTGGSIAAIWYAHHKRMDVPALAHAAAPGLPLAQAIGRWGNYFNQELYGRPTNVPWALEVEPGFRRPGFEEFSTFHPTFLYESLWNGVLVVVLLWLDRRGTLRRGSLIFCYLIGYGVGRGWIEALRIDTAERYLGLSRNNWVALLVVVIGVAGLVWWQRRTPADVGPVRDGGEQPADPQASTTGLDDHERPAGATEYDPGDHDTHAPDPTGDPTGHASTGREPSDGDPTGPEADGDGRHH